ncbi:MAG: signal peptidase I [Chloroflexi bacterium]|nr:signal peptidase I [Chloroflexota bacterium]
MIDQPKMPEDPTGKLSTLTNQPEKIPPRSATWGVFIRELFESIGLAVLPFFVFQSTIQKTLVEGSSMEPTLHNHEYVLVDKISYHLGAPQRGDVIVFHVPPEVAQADLIKRIIGLQGEKVEIRQGKIYINDQLLDSRYQINAYTYSMPPEVVGPGQYFVLGDNRGNSNDSHIWGMLPRENIVGKAWVKIWPLKEWGLMPATLHAAAVP